VKNIDPARERAVTAALTSRIAFDDPDRVVRGRVIDLDGRPMPAAVVMPIGVSTLVEGRGPTSQYGTIKGLDPIAVTNATGDFEIAHSEKATGMLLQVEARGMATKVIALSTGSDQKTITVSEGAIIRGRLMNHGKPVPGAQMGVFVQNRGGYGANLKIFGDPYEEVRIGTQSDGTFVVPNVPAATKWYVYGKMDSISALGATDPLPFATTRDGEDINVGDIEIHTGHRVGGKVTLSDGAPVGEGMRVTLAAQRGFDSQTVLLGHSGGFEFINIPLGKYEVFPSVRGYRLSGKALTLQISVEGDLDNLELVVDRVAPR
jgi:hypothetical protein